MRAHRALLPLFVLAAIAAAADYKGPHPAKTDTLYLVHADNLVELEQVNSKQDSKKDDIVYSVNGTASNAKTPLAEPIFLLKTDKLAPESIELYKFDVKNGHRELTMNAKRRRAAKAYHLTVTRLEQGLYRIEASEELENGEYGLSPSTSNQVFCFAVY
jgi:hypothetical protein